MIKQSCLYLKDVLSLVILKLLDDGNSKRKSVTFMENADFTRSNKKLKGSRREFSSGFKGASVNRQRHQAHMDRMACPNERYY